jgi:uncharacterized protein (DUF1015 family)
MKKLNERFAKIGVNIPTILLPNSNIDMQKWSVVACDQFSSERLYWDKVATFVGDAPSTLKMILPECYLEDGDTIERVQNIQKPMSEYISDKVIVETEPGFIYIERKTPFAPCRQGLIVSVDLETYDYRPGTKPETRPTEGTVIERLPPRMDIRREAILDMPHIMVLIDDKENALFNAITVEKSKHETVYNFDLMTEAGSITGQKVKDPETLSTLCSILENLKTDDGFLFAVGDGNHSLAAAKGIWEERKAAGAPDNDPARYALVEIENIYDKSLEFEPIHRVLFNIKGEEFKAELAKEFDFNIEKCSSFDEMEKTFNAVNDRHAFGMMCSNGFAVLTINKPEVSLDYEVIQTFLDKFLEQHQETTIDYIHGTESTIELGTKEGNIGILMKGIKKETFFSEIQTNGPLPRKTFSIGEAIEKRFYIESRLI